MAQALFEAGMYVFVFIWTPALRETETDGSGTVTAHLGIIFAAFMVCKVLQAKAGSAYSSASANALMHACCLTTRCVYTADAAKL
jgi:Sugar-tranasporters, 12 TM